MLVFDNPTNVSLDAFSAAGLTLNTEEKACLAASLPALRASQGYDQVKLFGKLITTDCSKDYYIALATRANSQLQPSVFMWFVIYTIVKW
jgi:hypothetical protein